MRLTHDNHEQVMRLFNNYWQDRIDRMNSFVINRRNQRRVA